MNSLQEVLKMKQNFQRNKTVFSKTPFFVIGPLCTPHSICPWNYNKNMNKSLLYKSLLNSAWL